MVRSSAKRHVVGSSVAILLLAAGIATARPAHVRHGSAPAARRAVADRPWPGATMVYGASAPYYIYGKGGGDAYGDDPIGGPAHVGDGGPAVGFGSNFRGLTDAEARRAAGWPGY